ncbi:MAG: electron transfer flavoprotein subunit beta/FixA family protein [Syntrophaceae bacterium]|jgi:electron transfer flavoprotein beta subunit|nr:electron transfer flavoprotein subunit beta/FixA family protein [Syntrophaceae bacterium]
MATHIESGLKNIVVAVKQVPDTNQVRIDPETGTLIREGVPFIVNPFDTHALEAGLQMKDRFGGQVIALSMGPPNTVMTLRKCLALGADQAILISDRMFGGADTLATSYVLTEAVKRIERENGRIDLIFCGKQTIDGDTAQVGPGLATRLGFAQLTLVDQIIDFSKESRTITVRRKLEGRKEIVQTQLPALLTVVREGNKPRYPTVPSRLGAETAEVTVWNNDVLKLAPELIGLRGSPTNVKRIFAPERKMGEILGDGEKDPRGAVQLLVQKLVERDLLSF